MDEKRALTVEEQNCDAAAALIGLFPDRAWDGTLPHAVLIVAAEVTSLRGRPAEAERRGGARAGARIAAGLREAQAAVKRPIEERKH